MKNIIISTIASCFLVCQFVYAQTTISSISVQYGQILMPTKGVYYTDFQKIAPQSSILQKGFLGDITQIYDNSNRSGASLSILLGLDLNKKARKGSPELRVCINYFASYELNGKLTAAQFTRIDTFVSTQTGEMIFVDSIYTQNCYMNYSSKQLRLDLSYIYRTNPAARFSGFAGIGASVGTSLNSTTHISLFENRGQRPLINSTYSYYSFGGSIQEIFENKPNWGFSVFLPVGIDFKIAQKKSFWNNLHLFYETRPGISMTNIPDYGFLKGTSFQHSLGVKINI